MAKGFTDSNTVAEEKMSKPWSKIDSKILGHDQMIH